MIIWTPDNDYNDWITIWLTRVVRWIKRRMP